MAKLNSASKAAAEAVASKIAGKSSSGLANQATPTQVNVPNFKDTHIPGSLVITPDLLPAMMPPFHPNQYSISDPLNPSETMPQATQSQLDKGMKIYEGSLRALKLAGAAMDVTREKFSVVGKHAKALGAGIQAAIESEKLKGNYLDYLNQKEITSQKAITLDVNQVKTVVDTNIAVHSKEDLNQKLIQASIKAEETQLKTIQSQGNLTSFKEQLGEYLGGAK